jgi:hypothetical protein
MGEDSYVVIRPVKYGAARQVMELDESEMTAEERQTFLEDFIVNAVVEWNWVDDDNNPLPQLESRDVLEQLYAHEFQWLSEAILSATEAQKN